MATRSFLAAVNQCRNAPAPAGSERSDAGGHSCVVGRAGFLAAELLQELFQFGDDGLRARQLDARIGRRLLAKGRLGVIRVGERLGHIHQAQHAFDLLPQLRLILQQAVDLTRQGAPGAIEIAQRPGARP